MKYDDYKKGGFWLMRLNLEYVQIPVCIFEKCDAQNMQNINLR